MSIVIGTGDDWRFVGGAWADGEDEELLPSQDRRETGALQGVNFAFSRSLCFRDGTVRFEVLVNPHADAGVIFRAADEAHFYLLHFPNCAQASRAQHFWVALSKMEGHGHLRIIKMEMVRRVSSSPDTWLKGEISVQGARISVRIGDYGFFRAEDRTCAGPGYLGLYRFQGEGKAVSWARFAGKARMRKVEVEVTGEDAAPIQWKEGMRQPIEWQQPAPTDEKVWQQPQDLVCFADGEVMLSYGERRGDRAEGRLIRSTDSARTWSAPEPLEIVQGDVWMLGRVHLTPAGRLITLLSPAGENGWQVAESGDRGRTWSTLEAVGIPRKLPGLERGLHLAPQGLLNLRDGGMLLPLYGGHDSSGPPEGIWTWGACHCQAFVCRSDDDGRTWSAPAQLDMPGCDDDGNERVGSLDLTEPSMIELGSGRVMALIRPVYSPWMWETWSDDGGRSWGPCVRGAFPGYAAPNVVRTASGALLVAHRLPLLTVHCSLDDGANWDAGTIIDSGLWAMGAMAEVEPDLVLYAYYDSCEGLMRTQRLRVGAEGLLPG